MGVSGNLHWQSIALCDKIQFNLFQRGCGEGGTKLKLKLNKLNTIQFNLFQRGFSEGGTKLKLKPN